MGCFSFYQIRNHLEPYEFSIPKGFTPMPTNNQNPVSVEGADLGRHLFYDPILSRDSTISCASCHKQEFAFSDGGYQFSLGVNGKKTPRNTPGLFNLAWNEKLFYDGRASGIEDQVFFPVRDHSEMDLDWETASMRLNNSNFYREKFLNVFATTSIDSVLISMAIGQFERTLISSNSKIDRVVLGIDKLTAEEIRGHEIMNDQTLGNCLHCHTTDANLMGTTFQFSNNGLDSAKFIEDFKDPGLGQITGKNEDFGKFKIPSIRNIALTAPYMHDGRFETLTEVIDFYSEGMNNCVNVDSRMKGVNEGGVHLSDQDKIALLSFLNCFTDSTFITNEEFSNPFKE